MGFPVPTSTGPIVGNGSATSLAPPLPTRATNDLLIAFCQVNAGGKTFSVGGGWTVGDSVNTGNISACWVWRLVDGTEAAPTISWTGAARCDALCHRYTGNTTPIPVIAFANATADASTTITTAALVSTADNSLVVNILLCTANQAIDIPYDRTNFIGAANADGGYRVAYGQINISGSTTDSPSITIGSSNWVSFTIEVLGTGVGDADFIRTTQAVQSSLENYSDPTTMRSTQVVQASLENYSEPTIMYTTQVAFATLRTTAFQVPLDEPADAEDLWDFIRGNVGRLIEETGNTGDEWGISVSVSGFTEAQLIRDPWDCDEYGRFQPGANWRPAGVRYR